MFSAPAINFSLRASATARHAVPQGGVTNANALRGVFQRISNPINRYENAVAGITVLFKWRRPSTILRTIVSVVIYPFNRELTRGPFTHIQKEGFKRISPPLANSDSASAVIQKRSAIRIKAAGEHSRPNSVFISLTTAVPKVSFNQDFTMKAATALYVTNFYARSDRYDFISTIAFKKPVSLPVTDARQLDADEFPVANTCMVETFHASESKTKNRRRE